MEAYSQTYPLPLSKKGLPYPIWIVVLGGVVIALGLTLFSPIITVFAVFMLVFSLLMCLDIKKGLLILTLIRVLLDAFYDKVGIPLGGLRVLSLSSGMGIFIFTFGLIYILTKRINIWKMPMFFPFSLLMLACFISLFNTTNIVNSIADSIELASLFVLFFLIIYAFSTPRDMEKLINFMIISSFIPVGISLFQILSNYNLTLVGLEPNLRVKGTLYHPNAFAFYLIIISVLVLMKWLYKKGNKGSFRWLFYLIVLQVPFIYTFSRGPWLSLLIVLLVIGLVRYRKLLIYIPVFLLIAAMLIPMVQFRALSLFDAQSFQHDSLAWRIMIWTNALPYFYANPIFGNGFGNFQIVSFKIDDWYAAAHNDYLKLLVEVGLFGLIGFLFMMFSFFRKGICAYRKTAHPYFRLLALGFIALTIGYLVNSIAENLFNHGGIQWYFLSYAAIVAVLASPKEKFQKRIIDEQTN